MRIVTFTIASTLLMSCLVTDSIDNTPVQNFPSSIVSAPNATFPLNRIVQINRDELTEDLEFDIIVRDPNIQSQLRTEVALTRSNGAPIFQQQNIIPRPMIESVERSTTIRVPFNSFESDGCLRLEVLISEDFEDENDVHSAVWWLAVGSSGGGAIDMRGCLQQ